VTEDEHRSGRPSDVHVRAEGNVNSVQNTILKDRRRTTKRVAKCIKLSYGTTYIISDVLGYSKVAYAGCQEC